MLKIRSQLKKWMMKLQVVWFNSRKFVIASHFRVKYANENFNHALVLGLADLEMYTKGQLTTDYYCCHKAVECKVQARDERVLD